MYLINLEVSKNKLEVLEYTEKILNEDLDFFGAKDPMELSDYDFKVFDTERKAKVWLGKYKKILNGLDNSKICKDRNLPNLLYKRRYIVQTLMNEKLQTIRHYKKDWQKGQLFNLYDQSYFLTVRLKKIKQISDELFQYDFELIK